MVNSIPVSAKLTVVNGKERYTNSHVKTAAGPDSLLAFGKALNSLQYNAPADKFVFQVKNELKDE